MTSESIPRRQTVRLAQAVMLFCLSIAQSAGADPAGNTYKGWIWENGMFTDIGFSEEFCFGEIVLDVAGDLNWSTNHTGTVDVCWERVIESDGRWLLNVPFSSDPSDDQSTRPLVSAGGNLFEIYGEEVIGGIGLGEERLATMLSSSGDNLLLIGAYDSFTLAPFFIEEFRTIDVLVTATPAVQAARTIADLLGTSWRGAVLTHLVDVSDLNSETVTSTVTSFDLLAGGACNFGVSSVFPDHIGDRDEYTASQTDDGDNLDNRFVSGGLAPGNETACTWSIDANDYLQIVRSFPSGSATSRFVVSDDNRFLINAPAPNLADNPQSLFVGYRAASGMAPGAIDGTYLFYFVVTEFGADGTGAVAAGFGDRNWQENDGLARGVFVFDSTNVGTVPNGESGTWYSCDAEMVINDFEHEFTGSASSDSIDLGPETGPAADYITFSDCDYQVDADGGVSVYVKVFDPDGGFEGILRGYANDNGEVIALTQNEVASDPQDPTNPNKDTADIKFVVGMKYTGDIFADADIDGLTNLQEFQWPLPPGPQIFDCSASAMPGVCDVTDLNDNGYSDIAVGATIGASYRVQVRDGSTAELISDIDFGPDPVTAIEMIDDLDDNGAPEIVVLGTRPTGIVRVVVRDSLTGDVQNTIFYGAEFAAVDLVVVPDLDGNGAPELAVLGQSLAGRVRVQARDALTDAENSTTYYGDNFAPVDVQVISDVSGNGEPEMVVHGRVFAGGQGRAQLRDTDTGKLVRNIFFGTTYEPLQLAIIDDVSGDAKPDLVQLGRRPDTGALRVQIRKTSGGGPRATCRWRWS